MEINVHVQTQGGETEVEGCSSFAKGNGDSYGIENEFCESVNGSECDELTNLGKPKLGIIRNPVSVGRGSG